MSDENQVEVEGEAKVMGALRGRYGKEGNCGDEVAQALQGVSLEALTEFAAGQEVDVAKYDHLNPGQRRMNIGNQIRRLVKEGDVTIDQLEALPKAPPAPKKSKKAQAETVQ